MKKRDLLRVFASITIVMFVVIGLKAQVENADYELYDANTSVPTAVDSVTTGTTTGIFVEPDGYYHPNYVAPGWTLTAGFSWTWTIPTNPGGSSVSSQTNNYVEVDWGTAGDYVINVAEQAPASLGSCTGSTTVMNITVIDEPATEVTYVGSTDNCGDLNAQDITIYLRGVPPFRLVWTHDSINVSGTGVETSLGSVSTTTAAPLVINRSDVTNVSGLVWEYTLDANKDFTVRNSQRTKYVYTLTSLNGKISRKSDYLSGPAAPADFTYYANLVDLDAANGAQASVEVIVNPSPVTGPIYHVPNDWAE
jgi:hypothetical protein